MKPTQSESSPLPSVHVAHLRAQLTELIDHLGADVRRVNEPRFQTLLETSADVVKGVRTAFERYDASQVKAAPAAGKTAPANRPDAGPDQAKPADPDEVSAKAAVQRKEARAPKRPHGKGAPLPPPQSGKPIWDKPHSS